MYTNEVPGNRQQIEGPLRNPCLKSGNFATIAPELFRGAHDSTTKRNRTFPIRSLEKLPADFGDYDDTPHDVVISPVDM
jgi:hypothetical protein